MILKCAPKTRIGEFQPSFPGLEKGLPEVSGIRPLGWFRADFSKNSSSRVGSNAGKSSQGMSRALGPLEPEEFLGNAVGYSRFLGFSRIPGQAPGSEASGPFQAAALPHHKFHRFISQLSCWLKADFQSHSQQEKPPWIWSEGDFWGGMSKIPPQNFLPISSVDGSARPVPVWERGDKI